VSTPRFSASSGRAPAEGGRPATGETETVAPGIFAILSLSTPLPPQCPAAAQIARQLPKVMIAALTGVAGRCAQQHPRPRSLGIRSYVAATPGVIANDASFGCLD
jgi:hypothetical protein